LDALSDNQIMKRVRDGELDHLGLLFERYHRMLFSFFYNRNKDRQLSQDLVQNVFVRVLKYRHRYRGEGEFKHWLFHIARNVGTDHYRKKKNRRADSIDDWKNQISDHSDSPAQSMIHQEQMTQLKKALDRLDPEKKEVLLLSKLEGLRYKEIGHRLGCSEGAVKVKVYRALKALKHTYKQLEDH
jgi:RNA polymerase sigma factor (sigma-70 family)